MFNNTVQGLGSLFVLWKEDLIPVDRIHIYYGHLSETGAPVPVKAVLEHTDKKITQIQWKC